MMMWLHEVHGHFSTGITLRRAIGRVFWPNRARDISKFCWMCVACQMMGPAKKNARIPHRILQVQPMNMIGMDFLEPISPATQQMRNLYVLIMMDYFTRMCWLRALPQADSGLTAKFLVDIFDWMEYPLACYNNGGSHFKGDVSILLQSHRIRQYLAPPSHPQSVGMSELVVQMVLHCLRRYHVESPEEVEANWDLFIPDIQFNLNNRDIKRFGYTPSEVMFGRQ